jgi:hypothetical protein
MQVMDAPAGFAKLRDMPMFFFDTRDDGELVRDNVGLEFPDLDTVRVQAAKSLAEMAVDVLPGSTERCLGVDVRDGADRAVLTTELIFKAFILVDTFG